MTVASAVIAACVMPPSSAKQSVGAALGSIFGIALLRVRDVGQASFSSLCDKSGKALLHYDVGFPISFNGHTSPKSFDLDVDEKPPVVLSHWDWDHLHAAFLHPHLMECIWIVPDQKLGPGAAHLARILAAKGNLLVHSVSSPTILAWGEIAQAAGPLASANDAGLTISLAVSSGHTVLLTGDADYAFLSHTAQAPVDFLVATHHGARFASGGTAIPSPGSAAGALLLSYGKRNVYRHPHADALRNHRNAGWINQLSTAHTSTGPRGDRTVP
ncbi:metallo-hydrolase/oxidoreductase [Chelativorans alearense]|uniref:metallo-hydrolase/oxidoreductase n=1 Tax=Chelativorans alearense TaxID=2681495 RepID=UPI001FE5181C|nr:metallo-hydrolase/oxidoreductase [Chelativorans alearense]